MPEASLPHFRRLTTRGDGARLSTGVELLRAEGGGVFLPHGHDRTDHLDCPDSLWHCSGAPLNSRPGRWRSYPHQDQPLDMSELPPVYDYSDDPVGFQTHLDLELAKPCQHCDTLAPVKRTAHRDLFGGPRPFVEIHCAACGERRASFYPTE